MFDQLAGKAVLYRGLYRKMEIDFNGPTVVITECLGDMPVSKREVRMPMNYVSSQIEIMNATVNNLHRDGWSDSREQAREVLEQIEEARR